MAAVLIVHLLQALKPFRQLRSLFGLQGSGEVAGEGCRSPRSGDHMCGIAFDAHQRWQPYVWRFEAAQPGNKLDVRSRYTLANARCLI
jgi:hypothetical protein